MTEQFLSEIELAARWAMSSKTLARWRTIRRGPPFVKLSKTVRYAMTDVLEFERDGLREPLPKPVPEVTVPQENGPQMTVRDLVASLQLGDGDAGGLARESHTSP